MKILVITQKIDLDDPVLGFFHNWILEFSKKWKATVICLEKGAYNLLENVRAYSLGKESGRSRIKYVKNFLNLILGLHREYDLVFVHMNQEYVLLGGFFWKLMGKKVYFWRNHPHGNFLTRIAVRLSDRVFYTSDASFTAKYKKAVRMPVGIDAGKFVQTGQNGEKGNRILFLGRISPIKKPGLLIEALDILNQRGVDFFCDFYGDPLPKDNEYYESLKTKVRQSGLQNKISFFGGVPNHKTPEIYGSHGIFVNLTPTGSMDKTIFEAALGGCLLAVANKSLSGEIDEKFILKEETPQEVADIIEYWIQAGANEKDSARQRLAAYVLENHSLKSLMEKIQIEFEQNG